MTGFICNRTYTCDCQMPGQGFFRSLFKPVVAVWFCILYLALLVASLTVAARSQQPAPGPKHIAVRIPPALPQGLGEAQADLHSCSGAWCNTLFDWCSIVEYDFCYCSAEPEQAVSTRGAFDKTVPSGQDRYHCFTMSQAC